MNDGTSKATSVLISSPFAGQIILVRFDSRFDDGAAIPPRTQGVLRDR